MPGLAMPGLAIPGMPDLGGIPLLPPGWEQATDPASGRPYYANRSTGETSWTPPPAQPLAMPTALPVQAAADPTAIAAAVQAVAPDPTAAAAAGGLPQGW